MMPATLDSEVVLVAEEKEGLLELARPDGSWDTLCESPCEARAPLVGTARVRTSNTSAEVSFRGVNGQRIVLPARTEVVPSYATAVPVPLLPGEPEWQLRPIRFVSVEMNVLSPGVGRLGGQLQAGLYGPFTAVASVGHLALDDTQRFSSYDDAKFGNPAVRGWTSEIGLRVFMRVRRPHGQTKQGRVDLFLAASFLYDHLEEDAPRTCQKGGTCASTAKKDVDRIGGAVDAGVHIALSDHVYVLTGLGYRSESPRFQQHETGHYLDFSLEDIERGGRSVRLTAALGFGF
jgi:hypothetical protein